MLLYSAVACAMGEHSVMRAINHELSAYGFSAVSAKYLEFKFLSHGCSLSLRAYLYYGAYRIGGG